MPESVAEEFGHVLVEVQQERHTGQLLRERREVEEVGHRRDLDQVVRPAAMLAGEAPCRQCRERDVLRHVTGEADRAAVDRQANDPQRAVALLGRLARPAQADDVDLVAGVDEGIALAADPRVAGDDRVDHDGDPARVAHPPFTSSHSRSFSASESASRSTPRSAASASTRR